MWVTPSTFAASFPAARASISESTELFETLERSFMWRGKLSPSKSWRRAWKKAPWLRLLSGRMSPPSTAAHGVASWIASLAEARARISRSPESAPDSMAPAPGSSFSSSASSKKSDPSSSSGKTSAGQLLLSLVFSTPLLRSATPDQPSSFELLTWVRPISEPGSSCWPTAQARDFKGSAWATPSVAIATGGQMNRGPGREEELLLTGQAKARHWPTATDAKASGAAGYSTKSGRHAGTTLTDKVVRQGWPTPATRDAKGANGAEHLAKTRGHHDQLPNAVVLSGLRVPPETGATSLPSSSRLNPMFVEWLMGWPVGWSLPFGRTVSECSATESSLLKPPKPGASSGVT